MCKLGWNLLFFSLFLFYEVFHLFREFSVHHEYIVSAWQTYENKLIMFTFHRYFSISTEYVYHEFSHCNTNFHFFSLKKHISVISVIEFTIPYPVKGLLYFALCTERYYQLWLVLNMFGWWSTHIKTKQMKPSDVISYLYYHDIWC